MVGIKEYAEVLGRVAALEQVIAFILGRVDARTAEDVLGMMAALKEQSLNAAAQVGDAKSVNSGPTESLRTTLSAEDSDDGSAEDGRQYGESRWQSL